MGTETKALYYVAWVIQGEWAHKIQSLKEYACTHFDTCKALRSPAHVTIIPPFKIKNTELPDLCNKILLWSQKIPYFIWKVNGVSHFDNRVIYVDVESAESIDIYRNNLFEMLQYQRPSGSYHPHITLAFRDLSPEAFAPAWNYFSQLDLQGEILQKTVSLLRHNGQRWEIIESFNHSGGR